MEKSSNDVFSMLISFRKNQTNIEEHIKTVHGENNHSNVVFAMLITLRKNQKRLKSISRQFMEKITIQMSYFQC